MDLNSAASLPDLMLEVFLYDYESVLSTVPADAIPKIVSADDLRKAAKYVHREDSNRFLAARVLFWHRLNLHHLGRAPETDQNRDSFHNYLLPEVDIATGIPTHVDLPLSLSYDRYGKPGLTHYPYPFNWSHSGRLVALIIGSGHVGIDVEQGPARPIYDHLSLCTPSELKWIDATSNTAKLSETEVFTALWSAKEAALKAVGVGLSVDPRAVEISFDQHGSGPWRTQVNGMALYGKYHRVRHHDGSTYALSWCGSQWGTSLRKQECISVL